MKKKGKKKKKRKNNHSRKHAVKTSFTPASLQIGKRASRQYCLLQSLQFPARNSFLSPPWSTFSPSRPSSPFPSSALRPAIHERGCDWGCWCCCCWKSARTWPRAAKRGDRGASRGMMVEFVLKQVHLQNDVGAGQRVLETWRWKKKNTDLSQTYILRKQWTGKRRRWIKGEGSTGSRPWL